MKGWMIAGAAVLAGSAAFGQTWQSRAIDSGALLYGAVFAPMSSMTVRCTAPSPQGLELITTGDHESNRTDDPFTMIVTLSVDVMDPFTEHFEQTGVQIILDGNGYGMPVFQYSDFYGEWTAGPFAMTNPLFAALAAASEMVVDTGLGTAYAYPVDGLAAGLDVAMSQCVAGWAALGHSVPAALAGVQTTAPAPVAAGFGLQDAQAFAEGLCDGPAPLERGDVLLEDLDGDGQADMVLDMRRVRCITLDEPMRSGAGLCGAAACSIFVHLTTQDAPDELLGLGVAVRTRDDGRRVVAVGGSLAECHHVQVENCEFHYDYATGQGEWLGPVSRPVTTQ